MKQTIKLTESDLHKIIKEAVNIIIENEWQWPEHGVSDDELNSYKKIAYNYALKIFPNEMPYKCLALLFKKTYRDFLIKTNTNVKPYGTIDDYLKKEFEQLDKYGWGQFERFSLPQGWWHYIAWLSKQEGITEGKSGINIKPENKGKFTATKKATGKSTEELTHSKNPLTKKRAIFAQNAKHWNHKNK